MKMVWLILTLLMCSMILVVAAPDKKQKSFCEFNRRTTHYADKSTVIIGGQYYADDKCTPIESLPSFVGCQYCDNIKLSIDSDVRYKVDVIDYNSTHLTGCFGVGFTEVKKKISITVLDKYNESKELHKGKLNLRSTLDRHCVTLPFGFDKVVKWGENSTTIKLQEANTENLDDAYVDENSPDSNYGTEDQFNMVWLEDVGRDSAFYLKFNLSMLDESDTIYNGSLWIYSDSNDDSNNALFSIVNDTNWNEETITWNNQPTAENRTFNRTFVYTTDNRWYNFSISGGNITNSIPDDAITFVLWVNSLNTGGGYYNSKEFATTSLRPYLNITYSSDNTPPYVSIAPENISTTNETLKWNITISETGNISSGSYGVCPDHTGSTFSNGSYATYFEFNFSGLSDSTAYCFNITEFADDSDNFNSTGYNFSFSTAVAPSVSDCPYTSVDCTTTDKIDTACDNQGNNIRFHGAGTVQITADIYNVGNVTYEDCDVDCRGGCVKQW